jgi:hypothetical protein
MNASYNVAGKVIHEHIVKTGTNVSAWSAEHGFAASTMLRLCAGTFNYPQWGSLHLLQRIAEALYRDRALQQFFMLEVIAATGLIPNSREMELAAQTAELQTQASRIARAATQLAANRSQKASKNNGADPEPAPLAEPEPEAEPNDDEPEYSI